MRASDEGRRAVLESLALLLMPAGDEKRGVLVEAKRSWRLDAFRTASEADVFLWGHAPFSDAPVAISIVSALWRELQILRLRKFTPFGLRVRHVHRLSPPLLRAGLITGKLRAALLSGVLVEMSSSPDLPRVLDEAARAAGSIEPAARLRLGSGGGVLIASRCADERPVLIRIGGPRGSREIMGAADALEYLASEGSLQVPQLLRRGETCGATWTVESMLSGQRPKRLKPRLIGELARFCWALPEADGPPEAPGEDLILIARHFPALAESLDAVARAIEAALPPAPGVMRHGDLWAGNLLTENGALSGVVDWDAWHPSGVPGADLLYAVVAEQWVQSRKRLGEIWLSLPWRSQAFSDIATPYWRHRSIEPTPAVLDAVGLSAWACQVATSLARSPQLASSPRWTHNNVVSVVEGIGY